MISDAETLKANEYVRRRILRLRQVREQSKNIAKQIRMKVNDEKSKQNSKINSAIKRDFENLQNKTIDHLKVDFENRLSNIGTGHAGAIDEDLAEIEWNVHKQIKRSDASERGSRAASVLEKEKSEKNSARVLSRKQSARYIQRKKPPSILKKKLPTVSSASDKIPDYYSENDLSESECANFDTRFEIENQKLKNISSNINDKVIRESFTSGRTSENSPVKSQRSILKINTEPEIIVEKCNEDFKDRDDIRPNSSVTESSNVNIVPPVFRTAPADTLRQLKVTENHSNSTSTGETVQKFSRQYNRDIEGEESISTPSDVVNAQRLQKMSRDNPFNAISEHIRQRKHLDHQPMYNKPNSHSKQGSNNVHSIRDFIQHVRHAPLYSDKPTIPNLPENYKKYPHDNEDYHPCRKRETDLFAPSEDWIPSSSRLTDKQSCVTGCKCPASFCGEKKNDVREIGSKKPLRGILSQTASRSTVPSHKNIRYLTGKPTVRCKPQISTVKEKSQQLDTHLKKSRISPVRKSTCESMNSPKIIKSYDQSNKLSNNVLIDSAGLVERLRKEGKNAYELAKEEMLEADRATSGLNDYFIAEARRIRGKRAMDKVTLERDCENIKKELDALNKEQRLKGRNLPASAHMFDDRQREKEALRQRQMEKAFEQITRGTKVHRHPIPVDAPVVQPYRESPSKRKPFNEKRSDSECICSDQEVTKDRRLPERNISSVNVGSWDVGSVYATELDEIPTRDSDNSTVKSIILPPPTRADKNQGMNIDRVMSLVEKQKEQLLREVSRLNRDNLERAKSPKIDKSKSPKRNDPKNKETEFEESNSSTEECEKSPSKRVKKKVKSQSPKRKSQVSRCASVESVKSHRQQNAQVSSSSSTISFQGLQILIEVKKGSQEGSARTEGQKSKSTKGREYQDSSTEMSITASQFVSKKEVYVKESSNSRLRFDSSESTTYMSPPEQFTSKAIRTLFGPGVSSKNSETQTSLNEKPKKPTKSKDDRCQWVTESPNNVKQSAQEKRRDVSESSKSEKYYETESTVSQISINRVSSLSQNGTSRKSSAEKGIQVSSSLRMSSEVLQSSQSVLKGSNKKTVPELDPTMKMYIRRLLEMSKAGVNKLNIDVSDVSTPSSSVVNTSSNNAPLLNSRLCDKIEKLRTFIDDNYTLLEEFGKENNFDRNYRYKHLPVTESKSSNSIDNQTTAKDTQSSNYVESPRKQKKIEAKPAKKNIVKHSKNIGTLKKKKTHVTKKLPVVKLAIKNDEPAILSPRVVGNSKDTICSDLNKCDLMAGSSRKESPKPIMPPTVSPNVQKHGKSGGKKSCQSDTETNVDGADRKSLTESDSKSSSLGTADEKPLLSVGKQKKTEKYVQLSAECSQRISNLSQMLEQIRKDKQTTLSSSSSPSSEEVAPNSSKKQTEDSSSEAENIGYVPLLADIPKPQNNNEPSRVSSIEIPASEVWEYHIPPLGLKKGKKTDYEIYLESFDNSCGETPERRQKSPAALTRNPIMRNFNVDMCTPHELSTIVECDTPITARNASGVSKHVEMSPVSIRSFKTVSDKNSLPCVYYDHSQKSKNTVTKREDSQRQDSDLPKVNYNISASNAGQGKVIGKESVDGSVKLTPFLSFQDYIKGNSGDIIDIEENLGDTTLLIKDSDNLEMLSLSSDDTLPDIIPEMIKRNLIRNAPSPESSSDCSVENSSTSVNNSTPHMIPLNISPPKSRRRKTDDKNLHSISGIKVLGDTSSNCSISDKSTSELEKALKSMGISWGVSTLKKTKETMALSSSSSSIPKDKRQHPRSSSENLQSKDILAELVNMTGSSVGLNTLLEELNLSEDFIFKNNSSANVSKVSLNNELEALLRRIEAVKSAITPNTEKNQDRKSSEKKHTRQSMPEELNEKNGRHSLKNGNPSFKVNLFSEEASLSGLQGSRDKTHHRTSTPVQLKSLSRHSSTASSSHHASNGLFGIESDLSSVKNISQAETNASGEEKDGLFVPNMSLKFGKLFDTTIKSDK